MQYTEIHDCDTMSRQYDNLINQSGAGGTIIARSDIDKGIVKTKKCARVATLSE
jgi:hypothetical protein